MIERLNNVPNGTQIDVDVAIVGGGACGLTLARQLAGKDFRVLVLESGETEQSTDYERLNAVIAPERTWSETEREARKEFHGEITEVWTEDTQGFGVRCRGLGGSTQAWAGKSATFDPIDFEHRSWVPHTGWPISRDDLAAYQDRAGDILNLGPNRYDDSLWELIGQPPPTPGISPEAFSSFFWQFARGRVNPLDTMRFGNEFTAQPAPGVRVLLDATVVGIRTEENGTRFRGLDVSTLDGKRAKISARFGVLSAGAIENARLLLASKDENPNGLGNHHDMVGRHLTDHLMTPLGWFDAKQAEAVSKRFGFYGLRHDGRSHMYAHGLQLAVQRQREEGLLNGAVFLLEQRTHDDPFSAMARLVKRQSKFPLRDLGLILSNPVSIAKGVGLRTLESDRIPESLRRFIIEQGLRRFPNRAAREYRFRGLSHKLDGVRAHGICEQAPNPANRVTLSDRLDVLGQPIAQVEWQSGDLERQTMLRMGQLTNEAFAGAGLPAPKTPDWISDANISDAPLIDSGHTMGTTRMAKNPNQGVVDLNCQIHGVTGLFAIGGSVMPTTGHANPTLMMTALTVRLADHLKRIAIEKPIQVAKRSKPASPTREKEQHFPDAR